MDRSMIERYASGAGVVADAVRDVTREQALAVPIPGKWSIQQLAVHLLDSDLVATDRMKRVAAESRPLLIAYDEDLWMTRLPVESFDLKKVGEVFRLNRELTASMLRALPDEAFARDGVHNERGLVTLEDFVRGYVQHLEHHMVFMDAKRRALGLGPVSR